MILHEPIPHEEVDPNTSIIERFTQKCLDILHNYRLRNEISEEEVRDGLEIFRQLHALVNEPNTRERIAKVKAQLCLQLAKEMCLLREDEGNGIKFEHITATHKETGSVTENGVVTLGDPMSGPNTVILVHHDVINIGEDTYDLSLSEDEQIMYGRTVQDNTIHLAATILALRKIPIPKHGAIHIVFPDFEENGCRGSSAITDTLLMRMNPRYPLTCIALESTNKELATAHRGKFSGELHGKLQKGHTISNTFCEMFRQLTTVSRKTYEHFSPDDRLGHSSGYSPTGFISDKGIWVKLDTRTAETCTPEEVESYWHAVQMAEPPEEFEALDHHNCLQEAQNAYAFGKCTVTVDRHGIHIKSSSTLRHPATFNPDNNETVLPAMYLAVLALRKMGIDTNISALTWGNAKQQNSNPVEAFIQGNFNVTNDQLQNAIAKLTQDDLPNLTINPRDFGFSLSAEHTIMTGCVDTPRDAFTDKIRHGLEETLQAATEYTQMDFMTDAGKIFNRAKALMFKAVRGFVYGIGDPKRLHQKEAVTTEDVIDLFVAIPAMLQMIHEQQIEESAL